jgi:hypothetical protein
MLTVIEHMPVLHPRKVGTAAGAACFGAHTGRTEYLAKLSSNLLLLHGIAEYRRIIETEPVLIPTGSSYAWLVDQVGGCGYRLATSCYTCGTQHCPHRSTLMDSCFPQAKKEQ